MEKTIYKGYGSADENAAVVEMINRVFCPNRDNGFDFYKLLPKLYLEQYSPATHNLIVREGDEIKAAIGLFYNTLTVGNKALKTGGIGNVAVSADCRGKGYMIDCMNLALDDMIKNGTAVSFLGGQRQRYGYFSYDKGGMQYSFSISPKNLHHVFGKDVDTAFTVTPLSENDSASLDSIYALHSEELCRMERPRRDLYNILVSWENVPYTVTRNGEFKGYFIANDELDGIEEIILSDPADLKDTLLAIFKLNGGKGISLSIPCYRKAYTDFLSDNCEGYNLEHNEGITILDFRAVTEAYLQLKSTYLRLCDTDTTVLIHGKARDERLRFLVHNNSVSVTETDRTPDLEFSHNEALRCFFSVYMPHEGGIPAGFRSLFPLPLYINGADGV